MDSKDRNGEASISNSDPDDYEDGDNSYDEDNSDDEDENED